MGVAFWIHGIASLGDVVDVEIGGAFKGFFFFLAYVGGVDDEDVVNHLCVGGLITLCGHLSTLISNIINCLLHFLNLWQWNRLDVLILILWIKIMK